VGVPFIQLDRVARYIIRQKLSGKKRYPLVLMLEPLFQCNLSCAGCGKNDFPQEILNRRLSLAECLSAVDESGAPVVSIGGGEPLLHQQLPEIVREIIKRKRFIYLCTNALLLEKNMDDYSPSPYFNFSIHLDGNRKKHDAVSGRQGLFDQAVKSISLARTKGFRVTINFTLFEGTTATEAATLFDFVSTLGVEGITVAPGFNYERASSQELFLKRRTSVKLFRDIVKLGKGRKWKFNHTILYLDFLAGNQAYQCTPWGTPTRNIFGWQKPCYLLTNEGYAPTFKALIEETDWDNYGFNRNPKCMHCMLHCGFEPTAVNDLLEHPLKALKVFLRGPRTDGSIALELLTPYPE
jgi:hopanoid biosynthesis associated radical SAM protein HpnH